MRVTVYHNVARDDEDRHVNFFGYQPGHPLVPVFAYDIDLPGGGLPELLRISEAAFKAFNIDPEMLEGKQRELAARYRGRELRSLSFPGNSPCCSRSCCVLCRAV